MATITQTFSYEKNDYKGEDARDIFGRRVVADYIVEWSPTASELELADEYDRKPPTWDYMGELAMRSIDAKHMKKRYDFFVEQHFTDDGLNDPAYGVSVSVIDLKAA